MSETTKNKRGYTKPQNGQKVSRSLDEINQSLAVRERPQVTQEDLDRMNKTRSPARGAGTIFILRNGSEKAERISRDAGDRLIQSGKAIPVRRRDIKDNVVKVNADEVKRRRIVAEAEAKRAEEKAEAEKQALIEAKRKAEADAKAKKREEKRKAEEAKGGKKKKKGKRRS